MRNRKDAYIHKNSDYTIWTILTTITFLIILGCSELITPKDNMLSDLVAWVGTIILANIALWIIVTFYRWSNLDSSIRPGHKVIHRPTGMEGIVVDIHEETILYISYCIRLTSGDQMVTSQVLRKREPKANLNKLW